MQDEKLSKNFKRHEFLSDNDFLMLGQKRAMEIINRAKNKLIPLLQLFRDYIGRVNIHCSYRNPVRNREVGGRQDSHHRYFQDKCAVDFHCQDMKKGWEFFKQHRDKFCYMYWDKAKNFFHLSSLTEHDALGRIGRMWRIEADGKNHYEPDFIPGPQGKDAA